jgi:hypothetical protein
MENEMSLTIFFAVIAGIALIWYVVSSIMIYNELKRRNVKVNFIFIRFMIIPYANKSKEITKKETGKFGSLFYHWVISIITTLVFTVAAIISKVA